MVAAGAAANTAEDLSRGRNVVPGVTLSRWTLSYFAVALAALMVAQVLMAAGFGFPSAPLQAAETLVVVHLVAIGWLSLLMLGALFQFVPVLTARPLHSDRQAGLALVGLVAGLFALVGGFLQLAGAAASNLPLFPVAGVLLGAAFALSIFTLGRTLWPARPLGLPACFVAVGLACLAATVALGAVFACALSGDVDAAVLLNIAAAGMPVHVAAGLGGWLTFAAMGVSYRLLAMFMLAPELDRATTRWVYRLGTASLTVAVIGGVAAAVAGLRVGTVLAAAGLLGLLALVLYGYDIVHLYRARMRRALELNSRMAILAFGSLALAAILATVAGALGALSDHAGAVVFLVAFGWLTGLGLAKLYKIVAFLTWLECYGPVLGKTATPRVQDLVDEQRAKPLFVLYFASTWIATAALLASAPLTFRAATAVMAIATGGIVVQFARTRRLCDVTANLRLPSGARRPRLFLSVAQ
jgi:hypothetical protein